MIKPLFDASTDTALRDLDPARGVVRDPDRYASTLARTLASDPGAAAKMTPVRRRRPARRWRMVLAGGVLAVGAAVVASLVVPGQVAYAGWTPTPEPLAPVQAAQALTTCLSASGEATAGAKTLIADERGPWVYLLAENSPGVETSCVMPRSVLGTEPKGSDPRIYGGGSGEIPDDKIGPADVLTWSWGAASTEEGLFLLVEGAVGSDVRAVTVITAKGQRIEASVGSGRFAAWWPGGKASARNSELTDDITLEATLRDGTTITVPR